MCFYDIAGHYACKKICTYMGRPCNQALSTTSFFNYWVLPSFFCCIRKCGIEKVPVFNLKSFENVFRGHHSQMPRNRTYWLALTGDKRFLFRCDFHIPRKQELHWVSTEVHWMRSHGELWKMPITIYSSNTMCGRP